MEKTKKFLIMRAKALYYRDYLFLEYWADKQLKEYIDYIKNAKTKKQINEIIKNLFN